MIKYDDTPEGRQLEIHDLKVKLAEVTKWSDYYRHRVSEASIDRDVLLEQRDALLKRLEAAEAFIRVMTQDGKYQPIHFQSWAEAFKQEHGYSGSIIEGWLSLLADALAAWRAADGG